MLLYRVELLVGKATGLSDNIHINGTLAYVVQQSGFTQVAHLVARKVETFADSYRHHRNSKAVLVCVVVIRLELVHFKEDVVIGVEACYKVICDI